MLLTATDPTFTTTRNREYIDACGGAAVSCLGYNHPAIIRAIQKQAEQLIYVHSSFFTSSPAESLAEKLASLAPSALKRVVLMSGGSEGMETSFKLAPPILFRAWRKSKTLLHFTATKFTTALRSGPYLSVSTNRRRHPFLPLLSKSHTVATCNPYRYKRADESEQEYGLRIANQLEEKNQ